MEKNVPLLAYTACPKQKQLYLDSSSWIGPAKMTWKGLWARIKNSLQSANDTDVHEWRKESCIQYELDFVLSWKLLTIPGRSSQGAYLTYAERMHTLWFALQFGIYQLMLFQIRTSWLFSFPLNSIILSFYFPNFTFITHFSEFPKFGFLLEIVVNTPFLTIRDIKRKNFQTHFTKYLKV